MWGGWVWRVCIMLFVDCVFLVMIDFCECDLVDFFGDFWCVLLCVVG